MFSFAVKRLDFCIARQLPCCVENLAAGGQVLAGAAAAAAAAALPVLHCIADMAGGGWSQDGTQY